MAAIYDRFLFFLNARRRALNIVLLVLVLAATAWFASVWIGRPGLPDAGAERSVIGEEVSATDGAEQPLSYRVIADKDIFRQARQRYVPPAKAQPDPPRQAQRQPPRPAPRLTLIGTVLLDEGEAAVISGAGQTASYYKVGDSIEGFVIKSIQKELVSMERGSELLDLRLNQPSQGPERTAMDEGPNTPFPVAGPQSAPFNLRQDGRPSGAPAPFTRDTLPFERGR